MFMFVHGVHEKTVNRLIPDQGYKKQMSIN
ncbi:MAG: hypothetical protein JWP37_2598 [Mucilaginibacter sp.]|nr:hypothetical protein [Mucilaginibacter sp.]